MGDKVLLHLVQFLELLAHRVEVAREFGEFTWTANRQTMGKIAAGEFAGSACQVFQWRGDGPYGENRHDSGKHDKENRSRVGYLPRLVCHQFIVLDLLM